MVVVWGSGQEREVMSAGCVSYAGCRSDCPGALVAGGHACWSRVAACWGARPGYITDWADSWLGCWKLCGGAGTLLFGYEFGPGWGGQCGVALGGVVWVKLLRRH